MPELVSVSKSNVAASSLHTANPLPPSRVSSSPRRISMRSADSGNDSLVGQLPLVGDEFPVK